jgi:hypothetical protein
MPHQYQYVPLLRTKQGEVTALEHLTTTAKDRIFPVFQLVENPPTRFSPSLGQAWSGRPLALDGLFNFGATGSSNDFTARFHDVGREGVLVIPCIEFGAPTQYVQAASQEIGQYGPGLAVKVRPADLPNLQAWITNQGWNSQNIDLIITCEHVADFDPAQFGAFVAHSIQQHLPALSWRTVTLASAAAPKDHGQFPVGRTDVPRRDWQLWNAVAGQVQTHLHYGDWGIGHPDLTEPPGVAMVSATVSVRYTVDDAWIILKGRPTSGRTGQPMGTQYVNHAQALVADPQFGGLSACWGDTRIQQIASGGGRNPGNRTTWISIGANRHFSLVADRLP